MRYTLNSYWMPFTAIKQFKSKPRIVEKSDGMYYTTEDGRKVLDGIAGLWCVNCGHSRIEVAEAVARQAKELAYFPSFQMSHPSAFEFADRLAKIAPPGMGKVFFTNSGSESVDTALKIALAYHRLRGKASKTRLIGRVHGYHGVGFGGMSVGGLSNNRKFFGSMLGGVDHLSSTLDIKNHAFTKGCPPWDAKYAEEFEKLIQLHDPSTIAALIIEPVAGSGGVIMPPENYLKKMREICDKHDILLIFDEVITGFGRVGKSFAAVRFGVTPDLMTTAKGLTNGSVPMGAVFAKNEIYDCFIDEMKAGIELFHGYTYSGHPLGCAAGLASLDIYEKEGLFEKALTLEKYWEDAVHSLKGLPRVRDLRNLGLIAGIDLEPYPDQPGKAGYDTYLKCFFEENIVVRYSADILAFSPPLIIEKHHIDELFGKLAKVLKQL